MVKKAKNLYLYNSFKIKSISSEEGEGFYNRLI